MSSALRLLWWAVLAALAVSGCARRPAPGAAALPLDQLQGTLIGAPELLVLPDGAWSAERGLLRPPHAARLALQVHARGAGAAPLEIVLVPGPGFRFAHPRARWDEGQEVAVERLGAGRLRVRVPAAALGAGAHRLTLEWQAAASAPPAALRALRWRTGAAGGALRPKSLARWRRVADLLSFGVAGPTLEKRGGLLAFGNHEIALRLEPGAGRAFRAAPFNDGTAPVRLAVRAAAEREPALWTAELAPGAGAEVAVALPEDAGALLLTGASDDPGALVHWGEPRLVRPARRRPPLVVLLTLDTTRRDALGVHAGGGERSPALDRLAREGTLYRRAASTSSWTLPAHGSLFTGLLPRSHGVGVRAAVLARELPTLAALLRPAYRTVGLAGGPWLADRYGLARGFDYYLSVAGSRRGEELARRALALVEQSHDEPLFLFANFFDPHYPFVPPAGLPQSAAVQAARARVASDDPARAVLAGSVEAWHEVVRGRLRLSAPALATLRALYAAEVAEMDRQIGRLLDRLRASGRYDDALIVAVGDHGELLGERGHFSHGARLDPELTDVPLIVKYPRQRTAAVVDEPVSLTDLFPTVLAAAGVAPPRHHGVLLTDAGALARRAGVLFEEHSSPLHAFITYRGEGPNLVGFERRRERMVRWAAGADCGVLAAGRWQPADCATPALAELARELDRLPLAPPAASAADAAPIEIDAEERARLRALGYL